MGPLFQSNGPPAFAKTDPMKKQNEKLPFRPLKTTKVAEEFNKVFYLQLSQFAVGQCQIVDKDIYKALTYLPIDNISVEFLSFANNIPYLPIGILLREVPQR